MPINIAVGLLHFNLETTFPSMSFSRKIIIRLAGGLGNQLFQFAAAVNLSQSQGLPFSSILVDTRFLASYDSKHSYDIGFMSNLFEGVQVGSQLPIVGSIFSRFRLAKLLNKNFGTFCLISSLDHLIKINNKRIMASTFILDGYFQHPNILFTEENRIRICKTLLSSKNSLICRFKNGSSTIGLHIRRGDYVTSKSASKIFRNISLEYYDSALSHFKSHNNILIFSDDRELSAMYAAKVGGIDVRQMNLSLQDEFCLLMACDDHIIANSTFSWWAAYLGGKPGGRVISPRNWYHDQMRSQTNPLLLPHFELIDA